MADKTVFVLRVHNEDEVVIRQHVWPTMEKAKADANYILDIDFGLMDDELEWEFDGFSYSAYDQLGHHYEISQALYTE